MQQITKTIRSVYLTVVCCIVSSPVYAQYDNNEPLMGALELAGIMILFLLLIAAFFKFLAYDSKRHQSTSPPYDRKPPLNPRHRKPDTHQKRK